MARARICAHISEYRHLSEKEQKTSNVRLPAEVEEERIDWTRGCVNAFTYVTGKGARKLCACTTMRKGRGKCKGGGGGSSSNLWVSSPREEDRARNLDKADKDGDRTEENNGGKREGEKRKSRVRRGTRGREYVCKY